MKQGIHPNYDATTVVCACGHKFETKGSVEDIHLDICSVCHPFYTGKQRLVDTAGTGSKRGTERSPRREVSGRVYGSAHRPRRFSARLFELRLTL